MELTMAMKCCLLLVISCALLTTPVAARPPHRQKRVSDQRLAELETLLALAKMKSRKYVTLPVGYGLIDVHQIGRRKRSSALAVAQQPIVQDPSTTSSDYDLADIVDITSSDSDTLKEEQILSGHYPEEEEEEEEEEVPSVAEETSRKAKVDYILGGLRPGSSRAAFFLGMRQQQHPRFI